MQQDELRAMPRQRDRIRCRSQGLRTEIRRVENPIQLRRFLRLDSRTRSYCQYGTKCLAEDFFRNRTQQHLFEPRSAVSAEHQQINPLLLDDFSKNGPCVSGLENYFMG